MIRLGKHTCIVDDLIRNIFQQFMKIVHTNYSHIIVYTDINLSALSISKARNPLKVLVFPYTLILYILIFLIHSAKVTFFSISCLLIGLLLNGRMLKNYWRGVVF